MMRMNLQRKYAAYAAQIQRYSERIKFVHYIIRNSGIKKRGCRENFSGSPVSPFLIFSFPVQ